MLPKDQVYFNIVRVGVEPNLAYLPLFFEEHNETRLHRFTSARSTCFKTELEAREAIFKEAQEFLQQPRKDTTTMSCSSSEDEQLIVQSFQSLLLKAVQERFGIGAQIRVLFSGLMFKNTMLYGASQLMILSNDGSPLHTVEAFVPPVHVAIDECISACSEVALEQLSKQESFQQPPIECTPSLHHFSCSPVIEKVTAPLQVPTPTKTSITEMDHRNLARSWFEWMAQREYGSNVKCNVKVKIEGCQPMRFGASLCQVHDPRKQSVLRTFSTPVASEFLRKKEAEDASFACALREWVNETPQQQRPIPTNQKAILQNLLQTAYGVTALVRFKPKVTGEDHIPLFGAKRCSALHPTTGEVLLEFETPIPCKYSSKKEAENSSCAHFLELWLAQCYDE